MSSEARKPFNLRAFVSVLSGLIFVSMAVTGLALCFAPSCRVARETDWSFLGHDKDQCVAVHVWFGIAFLVASAFHLYFNWRVFVGYFKSRLASRFTFRAEWLVALVVCAFVYTGTIYEVVPFSWLTDWEDSFKQHGSGQGGQGRLLRQASMSVTEGQDTSVVEDQAQYIYGSEGKVQQQSGRRAGRGIGRKTLREFCSDEAMDLSRAVKQLSGEGFTVKGTMSMREIANGLAVHPSELRGILHDE